MSRKKKEYIEIVVKVHKGGYPELFEELKKTPPRKRAERLKVLAFLGCMKLKEEHQSTTDQQNSEKSNGFSESEKDEKMKKRKERLRKLDFVRNFEKS